MTSPASTAATTRRRRSKEYVAGTHRQPTLDNLYKQLKNALEVIKLAEAKRDFVLLPRRWVVERFFAWLARFRRLSRDYERLPTTLAGLHWLAFACLLLKQLVQEAIFNYMTGSRMNPVRITATWTWLLRLLLLLVGASDPISSVRATGLSATEIGHPFVQNFTARQYQADPQVCSVTQDGEGVLYFGNRGVILEYDGVTWQKIRVSEDTNVIRALDTDLSGSPVYVGGLNDLGYLHASANSDKTFISWRDLLPADDQDFGSIYRVFATKEGVFFIANKQIMRWHEGKFTVWKFQSEDRVQAEYVADQLFVQSPTIGLQKLDGDRFVPASDNPFFHTATLAGLVSGPRESLVVGSRHDGIFALENGTLVPLSTELNAFFKTHSVRRLLRLRNGSLAVATDNAGIVVLDATNQVQDCWTEASGLENKTVLDFIEDREGGVWLGSYAGITRVQAGSPLSLFDENNGLRRSSIHNVRRFRDTLYVASEAGLYRMGKANWSQGQAAKFEPVPGLEFDIWDLCPLEHSLLVAGVGVIYELTADGKVTPINRFPDSPATMTRSHREPNRVFFGSRLGVRSIRFDQASQRWLDEGLLPGITAEAHSHVEAPNGDLWVGTNDQGVFRVQFGPDTVDGRRGTPTVTSFLGQPGLLGNAEDVWMSLLPDNEIAACSRFGLARFDAATNDFQTLRDYGSRFADGTLKIGKLVMDQSAGVWINFLTIRGLQQPEQVAWAKAGDRDGRGSRSKDLPHQVIDKLVVIDSIYPDQADVTWFASPDGLVRLDTRAWLQDQAGKPAKFDTLIRHATATSHDRGPHEGTAPGAVDLSPSGNKLDASHNSVSFDVAANTYAPGAALLFQTRLRGYGDEQWSTWNSRTNAEYTNLPEGEYAFEARARNGDDVQGTLATVRFDIAPPWQRTGWAYTLDAILVGLGVYALLRWRLWQLRARNAQLVKIVEVRTDQLRHARDAAETANRAKSVFLANMSHELRTPLNAILGYSQILLRSAGLPARSREQIAVIDQSGEHLLTLINEVLDLAKVEAGKLTINAADFSLASLLDETVAAFRPRLAEKGLAFHEERGADLPLHVHTDRDRLRQILFNLLSNAVKFTKHGSVRLEVVTSDGALRFAVEDTGIGITEADHARIFEAFVQVSDRTLAAQGTGLGLAISQQLVGLLGGTLRVESASGQGTRFSFDLPLATVASSMDVHTANQALSDQTLIIGYHGVVRRLLIVDDQAANRRLLHDLLTPLGFILAEAIDGAACLARCAHGLPDAVLLDLRLGQLDGFDVADRLRARSASSTPPLVIIALSASVFESDRQRALDAGCDDFLPKPFRTQQLLAALGRLLNLSWVYAETGSRAPSSAPAGEQRTLSPKELDGLLELSLSGDVLEIRKQLEAWQQTETGHAALADQLLPLVINYQMDELHAQLLKLKEAP